MKYKYKNKKLVRVGDVIEYTGIMSLLKVKPIRVVIDIDENYKPIVFNDEGNKWGVYNFNLLDTKESIEIKPGDKVICVSIPKDIDYTDIHQNTILIVKQVYKNGRLAFKKRLYILV